MNCKGCKLLGAGLCVPCERLECRPQEPWPSHTVSPETPDPRCQKLPGYRHVVHTQPPRTQRVPTGTDCLLSRSGLLPGSRPLSGAVPFTSPRPEAAHHPRVFLLHHTRDNRSGQLPRAERPLRDSGAECHLPHPRTCEVSIIVAIAQMRKLGRRAKVKLSTLTTRGFPCSRSDVFPSLPCAVHPCPPAKFFKGTQ